MSGTGHRYIGDSSTAALHIDSVRLEDDGTWTCQLEDERGKLLVGRPVRIVVLGEFLQIFTWKNSISSKHIKFILNSPIITIFHIHYSWRGLLSRNHIRFKLLYYAHVVEYFPLRTFHAWNGHLKNENITHHPKINNSPRTKYPRKSHCSAEQARVPAGQGRKLGKHKLLM